MRDRGPGTLAQRGTQSNATRTNGRTKRTGEVHIQLLLMEVLLSQGIETGRHGARMGQEELIDRDGMKDWSRGGARESERASEDRLKAKPCATL